MPQEIIFNRRIVPREVTPIFFPPVDKGEVKRIFEKLRTGKMALAEGPFRDRDGAVDGILSRLALSLGTNATTTLLGMMFFLAPSNIELAFGSPGTYGEGVPETRYDLDHVHMTDRLLTAGELVVHSSAETRRELTIALIEELYVLIASLLKRVGIQASLAILGNETTNRTHSALCLLDPTNFSLVNFALPAHPAFDRITMYTDEETKGLLLLFRAFNLVKRIREIGRTEVYHNLRSADVLDIFDEADAALNAGKVLIDHPLAAAIWGIRKELDIIRQEVASRTDNRILIM